jgi:hypothetical protein
MKRDKSQNHPKYWPKLHYESGELLQQMSERKVAEALGTNRRAVSVIIKRFCGKCKKLQLETGSSCGEVVEALIEIWWERKTKSVPTIRKTA